MDPLTVSAQFAAFIWSMQYYQGKSTGTEDAARFARENWLAFLPYAHEGLGRLLIKISKCRNTKGGTYIPCMGSRDFA